jgi:hypothetical protein
MRLNTLHKASPHNGCIMIKTAIPGNEGLAAPGEFVTGAPDWRLIVSFLFLQWTGIVRA